jgi:hypothetical protein
MIVEMGLGLPVNQAICLCANCTACKQRHHIAQHCNSMLCTYLVNLQPAL